MPDFGEDPIADDPALLEALRAMLRGPDAPPRPPPTARERFGVPSAAGDGGGPRRGTGPASPPDGPAGNPAKGPVGIPAEGLAEADRGPRRGALLCVGPRSGPG